MASYSDRLKEDLSHGYTRGIPDFPNHYGFAVMESRLPMRYGKNRYKALVDTSEYKGLACLLLEDIPRELRRYIPQDDPRWLEMRKQAQITGSVSAELLGFHDYEAAEMMGLPAIMHRKSNIFPYNDKWDDIRMRFKFGELPRTPMDPPGNVNCAQGKVKEANALAYMMDSIPRMEFREMGAIEITVDQLMHFHLVNVFKNNERIVSFPDKFKIVISPDGDITAPVSCVPAGNDPNDGHLFSAETDDYALELKYPTYFGEKTNSPFRGFEYYPKGEKGCKVYEHPKTYYLPQCFLEMLALKRRSLLFGCATYASGMKVWKIDMNEHYLSLILSVLIFLFEKFTAKDLPVPTDYFLKRYSEDHPTYRHYKTLIDMTNDISLDSPVYMEISGIKTKSITGDIGVVSTNTFLRFPQLPEDVIPVYQLLCIYGRRLFRSFNEITWVSAYTQFGDRECNINLLADTCLTSFSFKVIHNIYCTVFNKYLGAYKDDPKSEIRGLSVIRHRILEAMEKFLLDIYRLIFRLYGSPQFGFQFGLDLIKFDENVVERLGRISSFYRIPSQYSVFGLNWIKELVHVVPEPEEGEEESGKKNQRSIWTSEYEVESSDVYKNILLNTSLFDVNNQGEDLVNPHDWQYHRLIAVFMFIKQGY